LAGYKNLFLLFLKIFLSFSLKMDYYIIFKKAKQQDIWVDSPGLKKNKF